VVFIYRDRPVVNRDNLARETAVLSPYACKSNEGERLFPGREKVPDEKALEECCLRGWQAFKADWVAKKANPADIVRLTVPSKNEPDPALEKIKADEKKAAPMPDHIRKYIAEVVRKA